MLARNGQVSLGDNVITRPNCLPRLRRPRLDEYDDYDAADEHDDRLCPSTYFVDLHFLTTTTEPPSETTEANST